jgi:hypothetical protein
MENQITNPIESPAVPTNDADNAKNVELMAAIKTIRQDLSDADLSDLQRRYQVAVEIKKVRDGSDNRYGKGAMKKLASALGYSLETLRLYAMVADAWTAEEMGQIALRKAKRGMPICWTNLLYFAAISPKEVREKYLEQFFAGDASIQDIKRLMQHEEGSSSSKDDSSTEESEPDSELESESDLESDIESDIESSSEPMLPAAKAEKDPFAALGRHLREMIGALEGVAGQAAHWRSLISAPLREATTQSLDGKLREQFEKARVQLQSAAEAFGALAQELSAFIVRANPAEQEDSTAALPSPCSLDPQEAVISN